MKRAIMYPAMLAAVVLISPADAAAQQSPAIIAASTRPPNTDGWTARPHQIPQMPRRPGVTVPTIEASGEAPPTDGAQKPGVAEAKKQSDRETRVAINEDAFLLPVWFRGFWAMPPGGMTRFLFQPPIPINPDTTLAADPLMGSVAPELATGVADSM